LFNLPIDTIKITDIEQFLQSGAKEGTLLDFKEQFPNKLEKTISSMANTFGGMILIGIEETTIGGGIVPIKGLLLGPGLRERVIQIGISAIYPPLIPEVSVVEFKSDPALSAPDKAVVVIRVHESDQGYAVDDRSTIYIRADNISDRMRRATIEEVEWFSQKGQKSAAEKSRIIQQAQQHAQQFLIRLRGRHGRSESEVAGRFVFWAVPTFPRMPIGTPKQLFDVSGTCTLPTPTIAPGRFPVGMAHAVFEGVYWGYDEDSTYLFTEIHQLGLIYSEFEFWWDRQIPEKTFYPSSAAALLQAMGHYARTLYRHFGYFGVFDLHMTLAGIRGRYIKSNWSQREIMDDVIQFESKVSAGAEAQGVTDKAKEMVRQIYWAFGSDVSNEQLERDFR
jgi:hypothetical protein